jgi:predicted amidohydrolase YtcJ
MKRKNLTHTFCFFVMISTIPTLFSCKEEAETAETIITGARIWTGNPAQPVADAMAIGGDTILAMGDVSDIKKLKGTGTKVVDLSGYFVVPGFIDSHVHFLTGGFNLSCVRLRDAGTREEFIRRIGEYAKTVPPGTWILGGDWDHTLWGGTLPERNWIDSITPVHPVFINRLDGHMSLANSLAIKLAGVDKNTGDVQGGTILRSPEGNPTGIFKDNATLLIEKVIPPPSEEQEDRALSAAMDYVASHGVTSVHHMCGNIGALERARDNHRLITRIYAMYPVSQVKELKEKIKKDGVGDKWLRFGGLKGFMDGSLGSHTAAFFKPYNDAPADSGLMVEKPEDLFRWIAEGDREGYQVMIHAIGDRANHTVLDIYEKVALVNGERDRRFRIEHAQHLSVGDIARFSKSGIIASMQPYHLIDDGRWAEKLIGHERCQTTYAFRSLFSGGATVAFGSDWYVAPPVPLEGIYAAVTRRTLDGKNPDGWIPSQKITVEEALTAYTKNGAYSSFEENMKGTLEPGKLADFVVISDDLTTVPPERIRDATILQTWVGGKKIYEIKGKEK